MSDLLLKVNSKGMTRLLVAIPLSQRETLTAISQQSGISQQALIRSGIAMVLATYEKPATARTRPINRSSDRADRIECGPVTTPQPAPEPKTELKIAKPEKTPAKTKIVQKPRAALPGSLHNRLSSYQEWSP